MNRMMLHQDGSRKAWLCGAPSLDLIVTKIAHLPCSLSGLRVLEHEYGAPPGCCFAALEYPHPAGDRADGALTQRPHSVIGPRGRCEGDVRHA
jgi:hypothetical protein